MDREKDLLKQDLNKQETAEEINRFIEDTELMGGHEDIIELAKQRLQEISAKADTIEKTIESQILQVNELGGSSEELKERTGNVDKEIEDIKENTLNQINEIENQNKEIFSESVLDEATRSLNSGSEAFNAFEKEKTPEDQLLEFLGNNIFKDSIDLSRGVVVKKYEDEPNKLYFNLYLKPESINNAKNFLDVQKINEYRWLDRDKVQIWVYNDRSSTFK